MLQLPADNKSDFSMKSGLWAWNLDITISENKGKKIIGSWAITNHCIYRYRQRVVDDPAQNRGHRTATDIRRLIQLSLKKIILLIASSQARGLCYGQV